MSIEEAREAVHKWCDLWDIGYADPGQEAMERENNEALDRLILEVKASMPCYWSPCCIGRDWRHPENYCPAGQARAALGLPV